MEELSIYNLTITSDHRLKVNNQEVDGDDSVLPGDSESLLAWALIQVGYIQQDSDSNMSLHITDERPNGYGVQRVTIPPGKRVLIEALRKQTGRDLSYITEQVQREYGETDPSSAQEDLTVSGHEDDSAEASSTRARSTGQGSPTSQSSEANPEAEWTQEMPRIEEHQHDMPPLLAPPPPLGETPSAPASPIHHPPLEEHEQETPEPSPQGQETPSGDHSPLDEWEDASEPSRADFAQDDANLPTASQFTPEDAVSGHEDISSLPVAYRRERPELGEGEVKKVTKKKEKKPQSKVLIGAFIGVSVIALILAVLVIRSQGEGSYVATCVDERTMVRQATLDGCENDEASYYRWWYTPRGSEVPAVNQTVSQGEGTRIRPEDAMIREGFDPAGGIYGDDG